MKGVLIGVFAPLMLYAPLGAQSVQGRVVDQESGRGVEGAVVLLLDGTGVQLQGVLSAAGGAFRFTVPRPEMYRIRTEMIGRRTAEIGPFPRDPAGEPHEIVLSTLPIRLTGLDVAAGKRCGGDLQAARSLYLVWAEIEKTLRATEVTRLAAAHRFEIAEYERRRRRGSMNVVEEVVSESVVVGGQEPFRSLPPAEAARDGYIRAEAGQVWIYGPSTELLLSREFQDTHCFDLRRESSQPGMIGLTFEPVDGRDVPDISGVLWIDEISSELSALEFEFENLPRELMSGDYEGAAEFRRLADGGWIIESWWLRSPDSDNLLQIREKAGEVLTVAPVPRPRAEAVDT